MAAEESWRGPAEHEGWIKKQGGGAFKTYKRRYFRLVGRRLFYFKEAKSTPQGVIDLTCTKIVEDLGHKFAFALTGPYLSRTYFLQAESREEKRTWWDNVEKAIRSTTESDRAQLAASEAELPGDSTCVLNNDAIDDGVGLKDFELQTVIGRGSFGKVMKVMMKKTRKIYAMKVLRKDIVIKENMVEHTKAEKNILQSIDHPFIVTLRYAFQTADKLYLILDFLPGGELFFHLQRCGRFTETQAKQYTAQIALALEHLHNNDVVYRDLKPENCVLDAEGFVVLTDFGLAKQCISKQPTYTFCGTPEYLAPEILKGQGHSKAVDWWSLGVLLYEILYGLPPFYSENVNEMYELILKKKLDFPEHAEPATQDLLAALLERDVAKRLKDGPTIRQHPYFSDIDWDQMYKRQIRPVFVPDLRGSDTKNFDAEFTRERAVVSICHPLPGTDAASMGATFADFDFAHQETSSPRAP